MLTTAAHGSATSREPRASSPGALTLGMSRSQNDVLVTTAPTSTNTVSASSNVETSQNTNAANQGRSPPKVLPGHPSGPPKIFRSLSESPTRTIDSSPCCKTGPSSGPPK